MLFGIVARLAAGRAQGLAALPVSQLAAPDCALLMWATAPMLPDAINLMQAWDFTFKSAGCWAKQSKTGEKWAFGTGYCFRSAAEFFLLGTIGRPVICSRSVRNLIVAPVREHSRKPEGQYHMAEQLFAGPYLELFARQSRPGWDSWGNETDKFDEFPGPRRDRKKSDGLYQFIKSTWLGEGGKWGADMSTAFGGLMPSTDEQLDRAKTFTAKNAAYLRGKAIPINKASLYAAHFFGPVTAAAVIGADTKARADLIAGAAATKANPSILENKTVGDFLAWLQKKTGEWAR